MRKGRSGLHKKVSAIFEGVKIPERDGHLHSGDVPAQQHTANTDAKPTVPSHLTGLASTLKPMPQQQQQPEQQQQPAQPPTPEETAPVKPVKPIKPVKPVKQVKTAAVKKIARKVSWPQSLEKIKDRLFASESGADYARQKKMAILVPILFIVFIVVLSQVFSSPVGNAKKTSKVTKKPPVVASADKIDWQVPESYSEKLRDPMQFGSVAATTDQTGGLIIKGIVYSKDNPSAVVGNRVVHQGDKISGITVVKINKDSVEFEMDDKKWTQKVER